MTDPAISTLIERVDQLGQELRRQGRAAVAAQAAAESCLAGIEQLDTRLADLQRPDVPTENDDSALMSLLPLFDALMRVAKEAESIAPAKHRPWPWSMLENDPSRDPLETLRQGVRILDSAFHQAMDHLGIVVERRVGVPLDVEVHRVVEAKDPTAAQPPNSVVEVLRCGYQWQGRVLREADVVATRQHK